MKLALPSRRLAVPLLIVLVVAAGGLLLTDEQSAPQAGASASAPLELAAADVGRITRGPFARQLELAGELRPVRQTTLTAQVEGELQTVAVRAGEAVSAGQLLARFSPRDLAQRVAVQEAQLAKSREQLQQQQKVEARNRQLLAQRFISQNAYDATQSETAVLAAALQASQAELALARQALGNATISAPFAGVIAERAVEPGQHVGSNTLLFTLVDLSELELTLQVPVRALAGITPGQTVHFRVEGYAQEFSGSVARIAPQADASRSVPVYVRVDNRNGPLRGGMYAQARLDLAALPDTLSVPQAAVREEQGASFIHLVENGVLRKRTVRISERNPASGMLAIAPADSGALAANSLVLLIAAPGRGDGQAVRLAASPPDTRPPDTR
ncbi:efflux RND transporter periplasmic adaptor subunit [Chitinilyticum litopenaei]|uniref:efflux RND transporter periplasmic adaptor subunit n=1 Tax=Chitinilyticum litopenaei TaxID=1121276 RepID=UPI00041F9E70|nr:efflux RND transporter periplasmic adaptor subunit [Chitinilyticum litopenaei]